MKTRQFSEAHVSNGKRCVRADLYRCVRDTLKVFDNANPAILMLSGLAPYGEISCARAMLPGATITAVDRDPSSVAAARAAGADRVMCGDLHEINHWDSPVSLRNEGFRFIHFDACTNVENIEHTVGRVAKRTQFMAVTCSYGRDGSAKEHESYWERQEWRWTGYAGWLRDLRPSIAGRVVRLSNAVMGFGHMLLQKVYLYKGNQMPMLCAVYADHVYASVLSAPRIWKVTDDDLRRCAVQHARAFGVAESAAVHDLSIQQVSAWLAASNRERNARSATC